MPSSLSLWRIKSLKRVKLRSIREAVIARKATASRNTENVSKRESFAQTFVGASAAITVEMLPKLKIPCWVNRRRTSPLVEVQPEFLPENSTSYPMKTGQYNLKPRKAKENRYVELRDDSSFEYMSKS